MTIAGDICDRSAKTLFDETNTRWDVPELLGYLSDAQREAVLLKPTAFTKNESVQLVPGSIQSIPVDGVALVDIKGNQGADGNTPGRAVLQIDRTALDMSRPSWRSGTANMVASNYIYDDRDPTRFEVYPPQPDPAGYVQVMYAAVPPELTSVSDELSLLSIYDTALHYMVLSRAFAKTSSTQDFIRAGGYLEMAHQLITGRKNTKRELHPEQMTERTKR